MNAAAIELTGTNAKALWYLTRSTGLVALILLTATLVIGVVASVGWTTERWPRFLSQSVHRNLSLFCVAFVGLHVVTTVSDGYVPIGFADAFLPFLSPYRPIWIGLGALAFDLLLIVLLSSALRRRIGYASWRFVHWLAYLCWPIALFHALGSGSDSPLPVVLPSMPCAPRPSWPRWPGGWPPAGPFPRSGGLSSRWPLSSWSWRWPCSPPWDRSDRAGRDAPEPRPLSLLSLPAERPAPADPGRRRRIDRRPVRFSFRRGGSSTLGAVHRQRHRHAIKLGSRCPRRHAGRLTLQLQNSSYAPLIVVLIGPPAQGGGIDMTAGTVTFGNLHGVVSSLDQGTIVASVGAPDPLSLTLSLRVDQNSGALSGTVTGTSPLHAGDDDR